MIEIFLSFNVQSTIYRDTGYLKYSVSSIPIKY